MGGRKQDDWRVFRLKSNTKKHERFSFDLNPSYSLWPASLHQQVLSASSKKVTRLQFSILLSLFKQLCLGEDGEMSFTSADGRGRSHRTVWWE